MPTYDYECSKGHRFEVVQSIKDEPLERCQICRAKAKRLISSTNFILKGGGWYSDGYSGGSGGSNGKSGASETSSPSSSSSSKPPSSDSSSDS